MRIIPRDIGRARQAAKTLKANCDQLFLKLPLTWHQDTVAAMLDHLDWLALSKAIESGLPPSPLDEEVDDRTISERREFQYEALLRRLGPERTKRLGGERTLRTIAKHVAPSGRPTSGTAFKTMTATLDENGITLPFSLDIWSEDGILRWSEISSNAGYEHITTVYSEEADRLHREFWPGADQSIKDRVRRYIEAAAPDDLDMMAFSVRSMQYVGKGAKAIELGGRAYAIASLAWAPIARERRRKHDPVNWWWDPCTRPFMRVANHYAEALCSNANVDEIDHGIHIYRALNAISPTAPLDLASKIETMTWMRDLIAAKR